MLITIVDDISLHWFLRGCKFDVGKTKSRIETFYSFRAKVTEWWLFSLLFYVCLYSFDTFQLLNIRYADRDPLLPDLVDILNLG